MELRTFERAWLSGFIDGEGHVGAHRQSTVNGRTYYQATCFIRNTHEATMLYCKELLDGLLGTDLKVGCEKRARGKDSFYVHVSKNARLLELSESVRPYAITKREQWDLMQEYTTSRLNQTGHRKPYTDRELELLERLTTMNKRWSET